MRGEPLGDLQHRRATLADVGTGVVIPELQQFVALLLAHSQGTTDHRRLPHGGGCMADGTEYTKFADFESRNSSEGRNGAESSGCLRYDPDFIQLHFPRSRVARQRLRASLGPSK